MMNRHLALGFCVLLGACSPTLDPESYEEPTVDPEQEGLAVDLSGYWVEKLVQTQEVASAFNDSYDLQQIVTYTLFEMVQQDGSVTWRSTEVCLIDPSEVSGSDSTFNDGYYSALPKGPFALDTAEIEIGAALDMPQQVCVQGANLENPETDALPKDPADPRVFDFDNDGLPGYTVYISGLLTAEIYSISRHIYEKKGTIYSEDLISGTIYGHPEESFLEATSNFIPLETEIIADEDPANNFFIWQRLEQAITCQSLLANPSAVFAD